MSYLRPRVRRTRRAFLAVMALGLMGIVTLLAVMLSRTALSMLADERLRCAEAQVSQWQLSGRDRLRTMPDAVRADPPIDLPVDCPLFDTASLTLIGRSPGQSRGACSVKVLAQYRGRWLVRTPDGVGGGE